MEEESKENGVNSNQAVSIVQPEESSYTEPVSELADTQTDKKSGKRKFSIHFIVEGILILALIVLGVNYSNTTAQLGSITQSYSESQKKYSAEKEETKKLSSQIEKLQASKTNLESENADLSSKNADLQSQINELEHGASAQLVSIKNAFDSQDWQKVVDLGAQLHQKYNGSAEDNEAQNLVAQAQQKIQEAQAAAAAEAAKGYETGITYDQLARTPDQYVGQKVKFTGKVVQVMEDADVNTIRLAVNGDYDKIILGAYNPSIVSQRVLEDDKITVYGTSQGTYTYTTVMNASLTIPSMTIDKVDMN